MKQLHSDFNYEWETSPGGRFGSPGGRCQKKGRAGDEVKSRPGG